MIDIHAHLCFPDFDKDREQVIEKSKKSLAGVIVSSARYKEGLCTLELVKKHPGFLFASLGYHPTEGSELEKTIELIKNSKDSIVAVGEVGLDFHWEKDPKKQEKQKEVFKKFISLAQNTRKPLVIHSWNAEREAFEMVKNSGIPCVFHCFTGKKDLALEIIKQGFSISIPTNVLFSKSLRKLAKTIPIDRLMLETDAPFLDPDKKRKHNTPDNILLSAKKIAELRGISPEEVSKACLENAKKFFKLKLSD